MLLQLKNQAHVWLLVTGQIRDPDVLSEYYSLLSVEELARYQRFRFDKDKHHFLVSHALLRKVLSNYADVLPQQWQFDMNEHGKPELAVIHAMSWLRFNLSHTEGLVACVITDSVDCGVDVENQTRSCDYRGIGSRMFSAEENSRLVKLVNEQQAEYFFNLWTLKEAYVKARGLGLSLPTSKINFTIENPENISASFDPWLEDDGQDWQFTLHRPTRSHVLATAIRRDGSKSVEVVFKNSPSDDRL